MRTPQHNRGFSRLEEGESETPDAYIARPSSPPQSLALNLYSNEKEVPLADSFPAHGLPFDADAFTPSPLISQSHSPSDRASHYDVPPPAYHSGRGLPSIPQQCA